MVPLVMTPLRPATLSDLDLLVRHRRRMWEEMGTNTVAELEVADEPYRRWAREQMDAGKLVAWVVEEGAGGAPVASGCLWLQPVQPRPGRPFGVQPYLLSMFTEPAHRGKGHARRIVEMAIAWSRERGHPWLALHASQFGRPLYEKMGFTDSGEMRLRLLPPPAG